jgi:signal transduction histidine kinase
MAAIDRPNPGQRLVRSAPIVAYLLSWLLLVLWSKDRGLSGPLLVVGVLLPLVGVVRYPRTTLAMMVVQAVATSWQMKDGAGTLAQFLAIDVALGYLAATRRGRTITAVAIGVCGVQLLVVALQRTPSGSTSLTKLVVLLAVVAAWAIGTAVSVRRQAQQERRMQAEEESVHAERLRIAREVHDLVAHSIGVIAFQAGMGRRVIEHRPEEARDALEAIEAVSRETLAGLRAMVSTLRQPDPDARPTARLADLERLTAGATGAGIQVEIRRDGALRSLPNDVELSAYRIVQEALTNVVRHSRARRCLVHVSYGPDELALDVIDDGRGGGVGFGYGIAGMRERVGLLHGEFAAGALPQGGFRVAARLPLPVAAR